MAWFRKRLMLFSILGLLAPSLGFAQEEGADEGEGVDKVISEEAAKPATKKKDKKKKGPPLYYASLGLGKTLPEGFYRIRGVNRYATADKGYDKEGKAEDFGYSLTANVNALVVEYGMSDRFSFLLALPYVSKNTIAFDKRKFRNSARYNTEVSKFQNAFRSTVAKGLIAAGSAAGPFACSTEDDCIGSGKVDNYINSKTFSADELASLTLPTGEKPNFPATAGSTLMNTTIPDLVTKAGTPADGAVGLGDIDFGISYSFIASRTNVFSLGAGFRMPVGKFEDVPSAQRPTGEGLIILGVRANYDYHPWQPLWLSWQNQSEFLIVEGRRKKSSILNPNKLNTADPTSDAAVAAGSDGDPNTQTVTRRGFANIGSFRADFGLSKLADVLQPMAVETSFNYKLGAAEYYGPTEKTPGEQKFSTVYGFKFDGLGLQRPYPAYVRILREKFISGKNVPLASDGFTIEFAYYESF